MIFRIFILSFLNFHYYPFFFFLSIFFFIFFFIFRVVIGFVTSKMIYESFPLCLNSFFFFLVVYCFIRSLFHMYYNIYFSTSCFMLSIIFPSYIFHLISFFSFIYSILFDERTRINQYQKEI